MSEQLDGVMTGQVLGLVCGLPLFTKPEALRLDLLEQAFAMLNPGTPTSGAEFTYAVVSPMPFKGAAFTWQASATTYSRNVPPARVWVYRQPLKN